jgi:hypothetical protein
MYDPLETEKSYLELVSILNECKKRDVPICIIGGWATYFYVNENYHRAFGRDYMGSRDIDIFFDPKKQTEFANIVGNLGFEKDGFDFRYEKIYNRETKKVISVEDSKKEEMYNLMYIFLDLFSNEKTEIIYSWNDLEPLKSISFSTINGFIVADIDTLIALKCTALFYRDKSDKENKDAMDLYALLVYSGKKIVSTKSLIKAIEKILNRSDLLLVIAQYVLLDYGKQNIVQFTLNSKLKELNDKGGLNF